MTNRLPGMFIPSLRAVALLRTELMYIKDQEFSDRKAIPIFGTIPCLMTWEKVQQQIIVMLQGQITCGLGTSFSIYSNADTQVYSIHDSWMENSSDVVFCCQIR